MSASSAPKLVGLEIGDDAIRVAAASDGVVACRCAPLPEGAVVGGDVSDAAAVVEALRGALASWGIRARYASLVLSGPRTICRAEPLASDSPAAAQAACADRMRRYMLFGGQPTTVGHLVQQAGSLDDAQRWLLSAATPLDLVLRQAAVAKRCGLTVVRAEPTIAAVARAILARDGVEPGFLLVAHGDGCEVGAVRGDGLIYCRHLTVTPEALAAAGDHLAAALEQLADYHFRHARGREPIETMRCCGATADLGPLFGRLADQGVHADWLDPATFAGVDRLDGDGAETAAERAAMAPAVAAALDHPRQSGYLDLLPPPPKRRRFRLLAPWVVVPAVLTLVLTSGLATWDFLVRRRAAHLTHLVSHPTPEMVECSHLQLRESQLKQRQAEVEALLASVPRRAGPAFLAELPRRLAKDVWLERLRQGPCHLQVWRLALRPSGEDREALNCELELAGCGLRPLAEKS